jgi:hypothetical protein
LRRGKEKKGGCVWANIKLYFEHVWLMQAAGYTVFQAFLAVVRERFLQSLPWDASNTSLRPCFTLGQSAGSSNQPPQLELDPNWELVSCLIALVDPVVSNVK